MSQAFAAVDLGASSGRVMLGQVGERGVGLAEVHRFANRPVTVDGTLCWDLLSLWGGTLDGLRLAGQRAGRVAGIAVDSWAVDYALIDPDGRLLGNAVHYRDRRTDGVAAALSEVVGPRYARDGLRPLPFNTVFQLAAARDTWAMRHAAHALLVPDLFGYWLTGEVASERTNASTTGLLDPQTGQWDSELFGALGLRRDLFPEVQPPGALLGPLRADVGAECDLGDAAVSLVGSHDTASAVAGVPATGEKFAYISCGTWSLVGVELAQPVTTEAARAAGFSNELGVDGTVRFLRNVMGLWLLQECVRTWQRHGDVVDLPRLLAEAGQLPGGRIVVDPDRPEFLPPGDMPERLRAECRRTGQPVPETPAEITRCILDSLAEAYRRAVRQAAGLSGGEVEVIHLVGGGAQNALLCQLTADACELPVAAGPVEAAAYGNILVQARTAGVLSGGLAEMRRLLHAATTYYPRRRGRTHRP
jgi:rhamnulokinase